MPEKARKGVFQYMPIPPYTLDGVLPPYTSSLVPVDNPNLMSPYQVTASEVVNYFATTWERKRILAGWLKYRVELRQLGIVNGFQWLGGSFMEDKERIRGTAPDDLDMMVFFRRPDAYKSDADFKQMVGDNFALFRKDILKTNYHLDAFLIDLDGSSEGIVSATRYFLQLFSHQRNTRIWKGMLQVGHDDALDDAAMVVRLEAELAGGRP